MCPCASPGGLHLLQTSLKYVQHSHAVPVSLEARWNQVLQYTYVHKDLILSVWGCIICQEVYVLMHACMAMYYMCVHTAHTYWCVRMYVHVCMYRGVCRYMYVCMVGPPHTSLRVPRAAMCCLKSSWKADMCCLKSSWKAESAVAETHIAASGAEAAPQIRLWAWQSST